MRKISDLINMNTIKPIHCALEYKQGIESCVDMTNTGGVFRKARNWNYRSFDVKNKKPENIARFCDIKLSMQDISNISLYYGMNAGIRIIGMKNRIKPISNVGESIDDSSI